MRLILFLCFVLLIAGCSIKIHDETAIGTITTVSYSDGFLSGLCYTMALDNGGTSSSKQETCINNSYASREDAKNLTSFIGKKVMIQTSCIRFNGCKINVKEYKKTH